MDGSAGVQKRRLWRWDAERPHPARDFFEAAPVVRFAVGWSRALLGFMQERQSDSRGGMIQRMLIGICPEFFL